MDIDFEQALSFPSVDQLSTRELGWLAWKYGELDFLESAVFEIALENGLFACAPDGKAMSITMNPLLYTSASAIDLLNEKDFSIILHEQLNVTDVSKEQHEIGGGEDPWAARRQLSHRVWPLVFSRTDYTVSLRNYKLHEEKLLASEYPHLVGLPVLGQRRAEVWEALEGHSLCVEESSLAAFEAKKVILKTQYFIFAAVWDDADEVFEDFLRSQGKSPTVKATVNLETKAIAAGEAKLNDPNYEFRTLEKLRTDIGVPLGERAWGRVVKALRILYPFISAPGRKRKS